MPQVEIEIGGRSFEVACQEGEEPFLMAAAHMLDTEATALSEQIGRVPEARMLLMSGLMLADRTAALEEKLRAAEARIHALEAQPTPEPARIEVPVVPQSVIETLAELAAQAESLADTVDEKAAAAR